MRPQPLYIHLFQGTRLDVSQVFPVVIYTVEECSSLSKDQNHVVISTSEFCLKFNFCKRIWLGFFSSIAGGSLFSHPYFDKNV